MSEPSRFAVPADDPKKLVGWADKKWEEYKNSRPDFTPRLALAFYHGNHFLIFDPRDKHIRRYRNNPQDPNAPVRISAPLIEDAIDRTIAKLIKNLPVPEGRPVSTEPDDRAAAKVTTRILAHEWARLDMDALIPALYSWVIPTGWSFLQITWDPKDGRSVGDITDEETGASKSLYEGNIDIDIVPYSELAFDGNNIKTARWAIRQIAMTPEDVYESFGITIPPEFKSVTSIGDELKELGEMIGNKGKVKGKVAVKQLWIRPNAMRDAPDGLVFTWVEGMPIKAGIKKWPYKHKRLPFVQFNFMPPQGTPWGRTPIPGLLPIQMDYNDAKSRMATVRRMIAPKFLAPEGSVDADSITTRVEVVPFKEGFGAAPQWLLPDGRWMQQYTEAMQRARDEINERMGLDEAARGSLAGTSPAATAISQAEQTEDVRVVPNIELGRAIEDTGWHIIQLVKQFWKEQRLVATYSDKGNLEVMRFKGADIDREVDVMVKKESGLPRSKAGRVQFFMELAGAEIIPSDPTLLVSLLDLPPTDVLTMQFNRQAKKQERELGRMIKTGKVEQVDPLSDDHAQHAAVLVDFMQEEEWNDLTKKKQDVIRDHLMGHLALQAAQMQGQQGQGQPGPAGPEGMPQGMPPEAAGMDPMAAAPQVGSPGEMPMPVPPITELAMMGGHAGQPGAVPGIDPDLAAMALGR